MQETGVKRIIAISSIGIYETPLRSVLIPYRKLADIIESSNWIIPFYDLTGLPMPMKLTMPLRIKANPKPGEPFQEKVLHRS